MKTITQLLKEFWLPAIVAASWASFTAFWSGGQSPAWIAFAKDAAACFFLVSWATGQYFRVKKQSKVEANLEGILSRLASVVEKVESTSLRSEAVMTGGDSYCFVYISNFTGSQCLFSLTHRGELPLFDVVVRVTDIYELQRWAETNSSEDYRRANKVVEMGTVHANVVSNLKSWDLGGGPSPKFLNIEIKARNGVWYQYMELRWIEEQWVNASRIVREGHPDVIEAYSNFPRSPDGTIDWSEQSPTKSHRHC